MKTAGPTLRTLRLQSLQEQLLSSSPLDVFPNCPEVRHLHLDSSFYTDNLNAHLPHLSDLVSLSLTCDKLYPDLDNLFESPQHLAHLKLLELKYSPIKQGKLFDIEVGEERIKLSTYDTEKVKREIRLELEASFGKMDGWELPLEDWVHEGIAHTARTEEKAREAGITVQSNFEEFRRNYQLRLNEFHTRGVAHLHLFGNVRQLQTAHKLAEINNIELPPLPKNFESCTRSDVVWCKVFMDGVVDKDGRDFFGLMLEYWRVDKE